MEHVRAGDINIEQLLVLLDEISPAVAEGKPPWVWITTVEEWVLDNWPGTDGKVLAYRAGTTASKRAVKELIGLSDSGCVFMPEYEVRWRRMEPYRAGTCRVRVAGQTGMLPGRAGELLGRELSLETPDVERFFRLWGEHSEFTGNDWVELRIPHRLRYPLPVNRFVWLSVALIVDDCGRVQYVRWRELTVKRNV